MKDLLPINLIH